MSTTTCVTVRARPASRSAAVAAVYATATAITFSTVAGAPTPIYRFYRETLGLTPFTITLIFAVYSFTMIAAFLTIARLSDYVGRKPMILLALGLNAVALLLFFVAGSAGTLVAARAVQGVATGVALATLGALIADTAPQWAATLNSVTAFMGLALGALISGVFVTFAPWPTHLVYAVLLRDARRDGRSRLDRRNDVAKGRRLDRNETQTDRAESRGRSDGAAFPADPLAWALGGILPFVDALAHDRGHRNPLATRRRRRRRGVDGLRRPFVVGDARPRRRRDGAGLGGVAGRRHRHHRVRHCSRFAGGHVLRNDRRGLRLRRILRGVAARAPAARVRPRAAGLLSAYFVESYLAFALAAIAAGLAAPRFGLVTTALFYGSALALSALVTLAVETLAARR